MVELRCRAVWVLPGGEAGEREASGLVVGSLGQQPAHFADFAVLYSKQTRVGRSLGADARVSGGA
jgi:hypothetical protein